MISLWLFSYLYYALGTTTTDWWCLPFFVTSTVSTVVELILEVGWVCYKTGKGSE